MTAYLCCRRMFMVKPLEDTLKLLKSVNSSFRSGLEINDEESTIKTDITLHFADDFKDCLKFGIKQEKCLAPFQLILSLIGYQITYV
jgi:hypothetical protein